MGITWTILTVIACLRLAFAWGRSENSAGQNSTWGAATLGAVGGVVAVVYYRVASGSFDWLILWKWIVVAVLVSLLLDGLQQMAKPKQ